MSLWHSTSTNGTREPGRLEDLLLDYRLYPLTKQTRVLDYGCGTLRAGVQFIEYLDPVSTQKNAMKVVSNVTPEQRKRVQDILSKPR